MAGSADAAPLLTLLGDAAAEGRPALAMTHRRVAEILGFEPDDRWWSDRSDGWLGWRAEVGVDLVTFLPADRAAPQPRELRIAVTWDGSGAGSRVVIDGCAADPGDPDVRQLVRLAERIRASRPGGAGGGSGI